MATVNDEAFISGVLRGVEVAVRGGLITRSDVEEGISDVFRRSFGIVEGWVADMSEEEAPAWRQVLMGELIGITVAARVAEGDPDRLSGEELLQDYLSINGKIDHYGH